MFSSLQNTDSEKQRELFSSISMGKSYRAFAYLVVMYKLGICLFVICQPHKSKYLTRMGTIQIFSPVNPHSVALRRYIINVCRKERILKHKI